MANIVIPFSWGYGNQRFKVALEGSTYIFEFRYNVRGLYWSFNILTAGNVPIVSGVRVVSDYSLLSPFTDDRLPPGRLYCLDQFQSGSDATLQELGDTHVLIYEPST